MNLWQLTPERLVNSPDPATRAFYSARTTAQEIFAAGGAVAFVINSPSPLPLRRHPGVCGSSSTRVVERLELTLRSIHA